MSFVYQTLRCCNRLQIFSDSRRAEFEIITEGLSDALDFSRTIGVDSGRESTSFEQGGGRGVLGEVDFYTRCGEGQVFPL